MIFPSDNIQPTNSLTPHHIIVINYLAGCTFVEADNKDVVKLINHNILLNSRSTNNNHGRHVNIHDFRMEQCSNMFVHSSDLYSTIVLHRNTGQALVITLGVEIVVHQVIQALQCVKSECRFHVSIAVKFSIKAIIYIVHRK